MTTVTTLLKQINGHVKSRDILSWFLAIVGIGLIATIAESTKLHNEVSPNGGHHGDVAGGISLFIFYFRMSLFILAFACGAVLLSQSKSPIVGAILGLVAVIPLELVLGIFNFLLWRVSPWLATWLAAPFPYLVGGSLIVVGFIRKPKSECQPVA